MTDIVQRLRSWFKDVNAVSAIDLMDEAANEIERLRTPTTHATPAEGSVRSEGTVGGRLVERFSITHTLLEDNEKLRAEIARLRLTAEEREAIEWYAGYGRDGLHADTLRKLLERLHT